LGNVEKAQSPEGSKMKLNAYAIFDSAAGVYMRPFFAQANGLATRMFSDLACDAEHDVGKHPEDYSVYIIGEYDDQTGELKPVQKECLATAEELVSLSRNTKLVPIRYADSEEDSNGTVEEDQINAR
jgi:hypothetical protein